MKPEDIKFFESLPIRSITLQDILESNMTKELFLEKLTFDSGYLCANLVGFGKITCYRLQNLLCVDIENCATVTFEKMHNSVDNKLANNWLIILKELYKEDWNLKGFHGYALLNKTTKEIKVITKEEVDKLANMHFEIIKLEGMRNYQKEELKHFHWLENRKKN